VLSRRHAQELRHPHALRHTCARELLRAGATIADLLHLLGHASIKTTSIYLTSDEQRQEDADIRRERGRLPLARSSTADAATPVAQRCQNVPRRHAPAPAVDER
jgi:hypothetical protein